MLYKFAQNALYLHHIKQVFEVGHYVNAFSSYDKPERMLHAYILS